LNSFGDDDKSLPVQSKITSGLHFIPLLVVIIPFDVSIISSSTETDTLFFLNQFVAYNPAFLGNVFNNCDLDIRKISCFLSINFFDLDAISAANSTPTKPPPIINILLAS